jgi:hypothetical protein
LFRWRQRAAAGGREAIRVGGDEVIGGTRLRQLKERIRVLERSDLNR